MRAAKRKNRGKGREKRKHSRHEASFPVEVQVKGSSFDIFPRIKGETVNISEEGVCLSLDKPLPVLSEFTIHVDFSSLRLPQSSLKLEAQLVWNGFDGRDGSVPAGVRFLDLEKNHRSILKKAMEEANKIIATNYISEEVPSNPDTDGAVGERTCCLSVGDKGLTKSRVEEKEYVPLFKVFKKINKGKNVKNVLVFSSSPHLITKVKQEFPSSKILLPEVEEVGVFDELLGIVDLSSVESHQSSTVFTFEELLSKASYPDRLLVTLNYASRLLEPKARVTFISLNKIRNRKNVEKTLKCSKFTDVEFIDSHIVQARKKQLVKYRFDNDRLTLEELDSPLMVEKCLEFAQRYYMGKYNYSIAVDNLFSRHSDHIVSYKTSSKKIVCVTRCVWHIPNHFLPLMLAVTKDTGNHLRLNNPDSYFYGEVLGVYEKSFSGAKSYKECMKVLLNHLVDVGVNVAFTTYDGDDVKAGEFYRDKHGFRDTGMVLEYGTFGGKWVLLYGTAKNVVSTMKLKFIRG